VSKILKSVKNIAKVYKIYHKIISRLPTTFPNTALVMHTNLEELQKYYTDIEGEEPKEDLPFVFCKGDTYTVHVHLEITDEQTQEIILYLLHELGHLYAHFRYGEDDERWSDYRKSERYANQFASRWARKINKEGGLSE
jgi:hypothetical protein